MKTNTPFLPGVSSSLYGRAKRSQLEAFQKQRELIRSRSAQGLSALFDDLLPIEWVEEQAADQRKRLFPHSVTFWAWMAQLLEGNASCSKALTHIGQSYRQAGLEPPSFNTAAYCKARARLPLCFLESLLDKIKTVQERQLSSWQLWRGLTLKAVDGTSVKLLDTTANQELYPQPSGQKEGCGFPVMGLVGLLDLASGSLEHVHPCAYQDHDSKGLYQLSSHLKAGDLLLADRAFCSYGLIAKLQGQGVESLMRLHQKREGKLDWRKGKKLDLNSKLIIWTKPTTPNQCGFTREEWEALPKELTLRLIRSKGTDRTGKARTIYIVTTLLDQERYPTDEVAEVYAQRWKIEVKFRDIKTTMQLEMLRVKSPERALQSLLMLQITYNLVKSRQRNDLPKHVVNMDAYSFKATLDLLNESRPRFRNLGNQPRLRKKALKQLGEDLRERLLRERPNRSEPRAVKQRPKPYQYLTAPRQEFEEIQHKSNYRKLA